MEQKTLTLGELIKLACEVHPNPWDLNLAVACNCGVLDNIVSVNTNGPVTLQLNTLDFIKNIEEKD